MRVVKVSFYSEKVESESDLNSPIDTAKIPNSILTRRWRKSKKEREKKVREEELCEKFLYSFTVDDHRDLPTGLAKSFIGKKHTGGGLLESPEFLREPVNFN